ncbi:hypothetical protein HETIRDRAFT_106724 [Heterobasidion irregulare TC 32-1]|uniref:Uncharacterized protein n=1 Tax=Heterobasidion irregulare (strain TC 32-1) TaxID=747525 RepID=W4JRE8_HETIT|nr:uncharacterized protein HETIRDRAFT_106724 [Heterobasidion irregulare TC 32-1]ETW76147.1 hypothetical protein HETIRDRAFT_106724 [Heterobasidion irregulare TC 32-1]
MKFASFPNIFTTRGGAQSRVEDIESRVPTRLTTDPMDDFFGAHKGISKSGNHQGRHVTPSTPTKDIALPPPAYAYSLPNSCRNDTLVDAREPPSYTQQRISYEPVTLAQYMFKFGFIFPPLWFLSIFILIMPLTAPPDWELNKTIAERQALLDAMRNAERKWAWRSVTVASLLSAVIIIIVVIVVSVAR